MSVLIKSMHRYWVETLDDIALVVMLGNWCASFACYVLFLHIFQGAENFIQKKERPAARSLRYCTLPLLLREG